MKQITPAGVKGFDKHNRATRKAAFLSQMEGLMESGRMPAERFLRVAAL